MDASEDKNPGNSDGVTPLHTAAANAQIEVMKCIMDTQEDKNPADSLGYTPLHNVTENMKNPEDREERKRRLQAVKLIFGNVDDRNPADKEGITPLHFAALAKGEQTEIVEFILNNVTSKNPGLGTKTHLFFFYLFWGENIDLPGGQLNDT